MSIATELLPQLVLGPEMLADDVLFRSFPKFRKTKIDLNKLSDPENSYVNTSNLIN